VSGEQAGPSGPLTGELGAPPTRAQGADAPFLFAVGCVRSGTTMLRAMLDSHADVAVPPESYFVAPALHRAAQYSANGQFDLDRLLADVTSDDSFGDWHLSSDALDAVRHDPRPATVPEAIARLYAAYARTRAKPLVADRTPSNVLEIELLAQCFPTSRFVHLVRDGRDVVPSLVTMDFGPDDFASAALFWQARVRQGRAAGARLGPDRYLEIRYEDLVADPDPVLRGLCAFVGIEFDPAMLEYHRRADELIDSLRRPGHVQGVRRPPTPGLRDWRTTMTPRDVMLFEALAGEMLDTFGYERSGLVTSVRVRVEAAAHRARRTVAARARTLRTRVGRRMASSATPGDSSDPERGGD